MIDIYADIEVLGRERVCEHLLRLEPAGLSRRFLSPVSEASVGSYVAKADPLVLVTWEENGFVRGVLEVYESGRTVEAALSIEPAWRGRGLGALMFVTALEEVRRKGFETLELYVATHNTSMRSLAQRMGGEEYLVEPGLIHSTVSLAPRHL